MLRRLRAIAAANASSPASAGSIQGLSVGTDVFTWTGAPTVKLVSDRIAIAAIGRDREAVDPERRDTVAEQIEIAHVARTGK